MRSNRNFVNVVPVITCILIIMLCILLPIVAFADGTGKIIPKERLTPKELRSAETIKQYDRQGAVLPWKTYQLDETINRPKYWNGYGVDPSGVNYWTYWDEDTECLPRYSEVWEGTDHCKQEEEETLQMVTIPEPSGMMLLGTGICFIWLMIRRKK